MVRGTVSSELLSVENSLLTGKLTGKIQFFACFLTAI